MKQPRQSRSQPALTFTNYAHDWLATRPLKPRTAVEYRGLLVRHILPALGERKLTDLTPAHVRSWHAQCTPDHPTTRAKAYALARTIAASAEDDGIIERSPFRIRGAGTPPKPAPVDLPEPERVADVAAHMPEQLRLSVVLGLWTALRLGEVLGLQRRDIDLVRGVLHVRRAAVALPGGPQLGTPKSAAGLRTVGIPPHIQPLVADHLDRHVEPHAQALLFASQAPGTPVATSTFYKHWFAARAAAGLPQLKFHHLRHLGGTLSARAGGTLAEIMARLGHTSPAVAMRYQHAAADRENRLAASLSQMAGSPA